MGKRGYEHEIPYPNGNASLHTYNIDRDHGCIHGDDLIMQNTDLKKQKAYCDKIIWMGTFHGNDLGMSCLMVRGCKYPEKMADCPAHNKKAICPYTITGTC
jgi:hypothetical protein